MVLNNKNEYLVFAHFSCGELYLKLSALDIITNLGY